MTTTFSNLCNAPRKSTKGERRRARDEAEARRIKSAFQAQTAPLLSAEEELELAHRIKAGDQAAREALTLANMGLVVNIAIQFKPQGMELDDLIQEGHLGLIRATEDFDPEAHGTRFCTYAACWIRSFIMRATSNNGSVVSLPYYLRILRNRFDRVKAQMMSRSLETNALQVAPTLEDVADHLGINHRRLSILRQAQLDCVSYSSSSGDDEDSRPSEEQIFEECPPEKPLEIAEEMERLHAALNRLSPFEAWLIRRRYRFDDHDDIPNDQSDELRTYCDLKRECGLSSHRLKRIERDALEKLGAAISETSTETSPFSNDSLPRRDRPRATA